MVGRLDAPNVGGGRSPNASDVNLHASMASAFSITSHTTIEAPSREKSPDADSLYSCSIPPPPGERALRERDQNVERNNWANTSTTTMNMEDESIGEFAPHPAKNTINQRVAPPRASSSASSVTTRRRSSTKSNRNKDDDEDDDFDESAKFVKPKRQRLVTMPGRPGRKPIGRRPNLDESIMKTVKALSSVPGTCYQDPFDLVRKPRERFLGECAQVGSGR